MNLYLWLTKLTPAHFSLVHQLKQLGYDGVEIPTGDYSAAELAAIRQLLSDEGMAVTVATLLTAEFNPISPDAKIRAAALNKVSRDLDVAQAVGAEVLIGPMHSAHKLFHGRGPTEQEFDHCVAFLQAAGERAAQADIRLAVEPLNRFECYFLNTAEQARQLADAVDDDHVGILYDTHHANIEECNVYTAITSLGNRLQHFHVSESHRGTPGTGMVDWGESFRALRDMNYQGWLVVESFASDVDGIPDAVNIWRDCFASKDEVATEALSLIKSHI